MKIVTHNDRFHADDVCATAVLKIKFGDQITHIIRTRDEDIIRSADIVFDVGHVYDPDINRFDHHQIHGAGKRENGIPYAAFGLVWKKFGADICGSQEAADMIDKKMIQMVDAGDNGVFPYTYTQQDVREYVLDTICHSFGSTWTEEDKYDKVFFEMVDLVEKIIRREIKVAQDKVKAIPFIEKVYQDTSDKRIIIFDEYYPWGDVLKKYSDVFFVVSPTKEKDQWRISTIQDQQLQNKKSFPMSWAGLRDEELEKVTGVKGSKFCHRTLFLTVADSKESAIKLAKIALES
jgi:uncharacterized UPF0160 family protein